MIFFSPMQHSFDRRQPGLLGSSHQSDTLGKAVAALLKHHPSQLGRICEQLQGRQLPNTLRHLIWSMRVQGKDIDSGHSSSDLETEFEEIISQFKISLSWGLKELGVSSAVHSPIAGVIKHAVTEAYKYRPGLHSELVSEMQIKQAVEALNVLYVYNRTYEPQYALLVYPLIFTFQNEHLESGRSKLVWFFFKVIRYTCQVILKKQSVSKCLSERIVTSF